MLKETKVNDQCFFLFLAKNELDLCRAHTEHNSNPLYTSYLCMKFGFCKLEETKVVDQTLFFYLYQQRPCP